MVEIFYDEAPYIVTDYEQQLEAYNTDKWEGWTRVPANGPAAFINDNIDTYLNLRPKVAAAEAGGGGNNNSNLIYVAVAVAVAVVAIVAVLVLRRGRGRALEE